MNEWMTTKLIRKIASGDELGAQGYGTLSVGIRHTMQITYTLGTAATLPTEIFLLGLDFIVNIYLCLKFVWARKRRPEDIESQINLLQELALSELTEFIAPLAFILAFISAYYGPNGELLGNVLATIWQYEAIEDAPGFLMIVLMFFVVDFCSTIVTSIVLKLCCNINFFTVLLGMEKEYGTNIFAILSMYLITVRLYYDIKPIT